MKLIKTSLLSGGSTFLKMIIGILSLKIIAMTVGPEGVGILGQFMGFLNIISIVSAGGITLGIIKYVAEFMTDYERLSEFLSSAIFYTFIFSICSMILGLLFSTKLSFWIFGSDSFRNLIQILSLVQVLIVGNSFLCSVINGLGKIKKLVFVNISGSLIGLIFMSVSAVYSNLNGIILAFILSQGAVIFVSIGLLYSETWFSFLWQFKIKKKWMVNLSHYSLMAIVSAMAVSMAQVFVRRELNQLFGWDSVGLWQAVIRISDSYLLFVTTALTAYYLPKLSQHSTISSLKKEVWHTSLTLMPLLAFILIILYFCREIILFWLYSKDFSLAADLFLFQLIGDFFRVAGWLFTYLLIAKSKSKLYIMTEIILAIIFIITSKILTLKYGLIGVTYAFSLTYFLYWIMMLISYIIFLKQETLRL